MLSLSRYSAANWKLVDTSPNSKYTVQVFNVSQQCALCCVFIKESISKQRSSSCQFAGLINAAWWLIATIWGGWSCVGPPSPRCPRQPQWSRWSQSLHHTRGTAAGSCSTHHICCLHRREEVMSHLYWFHYWLIIDNYVFCMYFQLDHRWVRPLPFSRPSDLFLRIWGWHLFKV